MNTTSKIYKNLGRLLVLSVFTIAFSACNQEFDRMISDKDYNDSTSVTYGSQKVLYIIADGARGTSMRDARSPRISALLPKSIYTWFSLSDETTTGIGTSWADMLTGVRKDKHKVVDNDFSKSDLSNLIYNRVREFDEDASVKVYTRSNAFKTNFAGNADVSEVLGSDAEVKARTVAGLADSAATFITAHFSGIDEAGAQSGYDLSFPAYSNAISTFDGYVGEMIDALKARPSYSRENWLVVITSSRGGQYTLPPDQNDNTIFSNTRANTFTIFHADRYKTRFIGKPYLGNRYQGDFVRFDGERKAQVSAGDNSVYNLGVGEFTVEIKVKKNIGPNQNYEFRYPSMFGKRPEWSSGWPSNGWVLFLENKYWMFNARGTTGAEQVRGGDLADATWNSIAAVGVVRDNKRYVRTFTNGVFNNERDISGWGNLDNNSLVTLGYIAGQGHGFPDFYLADAKIWKAALPDSIITRFACDTYVDEGHPYYDFLAGYWPIVGGSADNVIRDEGPLGSHMTFSGGAPAWSRLSEFICAPSIDNLGSLVPRSVDIPTQIISWLRLPRLESWGLDGRVWLDQ